MNRSLLTLAAALTLSGCASWEIVAVPPGESVLISLAQKAEPLEPIAAYHPEEDSTRPRVNVPEVKPPLPEYDAVDDQFAIGEFCLHQQKYAEAIEALKKAVAMDPLYADAWNSLAIAYQESGDTENAAIALKKHQELVAP